MYSSSSFASIVTCGDMEQLNNSSPLGQIVNPLILQNFTVRTLDPESPLGV